MADGWAKRWEWLVAPVCEAALVLMAGLVAWATRSPMLFASLGPTAYELVETPNRPSARGYNVLVGHGCGIASGLLALWMLGQWESKASPGGEVTLMRVLVATAAALLTVMFSLLAKGDAAGGGGLGAGGGAGVGAAFEDGRIYGAGDCLPAANGRAFAAVAAEAGTADVLVRRIAKCSRMGRSG